LDYARDKLQRKNLDLIIANRVGDNCGFDRDDNTATALWKNGERSYPTLSKVDLARELIELAAEHFYAVRGSETQPKLTIISNKD
jgi:phosphopantothenoylcysteine decarboxylase/phosphopantothenate--cysteine ligase